MKKKAPVFYTNENVSKKFNSNFDLVNYAISLAENMIASGRDARVKSDVENRAMLVLQEIREGKDLFDEIKETVHAQSSTHSTQQDKADEQRAEKRKQRSYDHKED